MHWQNSHYYTNANLLGLENASSEERKKAFYEMKAEEIVDKLPMFQHWSPTFDGSYIRNDVTLGMLSNPANPVGKPTWCKQIVIGDTAHDVSRSSLLYDHVVDLSREVF